MVNKFLVKIDENRTILIKDYTKEYREKVVEFLKKIAIEEFEFEDWRHYFDKAEFLEINPETETFLLAIDNFNNIIGTIGIMDDKNLATAKLHSLYLEKEYRKKGIASKLYDYSIEFAKKVRI